MPGVFYQVSRLRDLSAREVHEMYKLRVDVFIVEQQATFQEIDDQDAAPETLHLLAWDGATRQLVGTTRVFPRDEHVVLGRFLVPKARRGTGLAHDVMTRTLRVVHEQWPGRDVLIAAQAPLAGYYRDNYGYRAEGELFDDAGVPHQWMRLPAGDVAALAQSAELGGAYPLVPSTSRR